MLTILVVLLIAAVVFGGVGHSYSWAPYYSWSPLGVILVVIFVLWLLGQLAF